MNLVPGAQQLSVLLAQLDQSRGEGDLSKMGFQGAEAHSVRVGRIHPSNTRTCSHSTVPQHPARGGRENSCSGALRLHPVPLETV